MFDEGAGTLVKPLTWQGDMGFGPRRDGRATFRRLDDLPLWAGVWDLDDAGPHAVRQYLRAYGPATPEHLQYWLGNGLSAGSRRIRAWLDGLADEVVEVEVEGTTARLLRDDLEGLQAARPGSGVVLLPGHDPWVIGPGTKDPHVVPPARRTPVTRKANLVVAGGVVRGTWVARGEELRVTWFGELGAPPRSALDEEASRLAGLLGRPLTPTIEVE